MKPGRKHFHPYKYVAVVLSLVYFLNSGLLAPLAEANFWEERQEALKTRVKGTPQLASLPLGQISRHPGMPLAGIHNGFNHAVVVDSGLKHAGMTTKNHNLYLNYTRVKEIHTAKGSASPQVIIIQDIHANQEAQANIAKAIEELARQKSTPQKPLFVGVEGVSGPFDFSRFRAFPDKRVTKAVADHFLTENKISAPSYVGLTIGEPLPEFYGVDDPVGYKANVEAYRKSAHGLDRLKKDWAKRAVEVAAEKAAVYNPWFAAFDAAQSAYRAGRSSLGGYSTRLLRLLDDSSPRLISGEVRRGPPPSPPTVQRGGEIIRFLEAYDLESSLDFSAVERERQRVLERLAPAMSRKEADDLLYQSRAFSTGQLSYAGYYDMLRTLLKRHSISLSNSPAFDAYLRYVLLADEINADALLLELEQMEEEALARLAVTPEEKKLSQESEMHHLTGKMLDFALTPREWEKYRKFTIDDLRFTNFKAFYELADLRSKKMINNLLNRNSYIVNRKCSVLVAGGFHSDLITRELKNKGISYAVLTPKLTKVDTARGSEYLSVFTREKTPLEKLLQGDRLFLANAETCTGHPAARLMNNRIVAVNAAFNEAWTENGVTKSNNGDGTIWVNTGYANSKPLLGTTNPGIAKEHEVIGSDSIPPYGILYYLQDDQVFRVSVFSILAACLAVRYGVDVSQLIDVVSKHWPELLAAGMMAFGVIVSSQRPLKTGKRVRADILGKPLSEIEIRKNARESLIAAGIATLGELIEKSEAWLLKVRNVGPKTIQTIRLYLRRNVWMSSLDDSELTLGQTPHVELPPIRTVRDLKHRGAIMAAVKEHIRLAVEAFPDRRQVLESLLQEITLRPRVPSAPITPIGLLPTDRPGAERWNQAIGRFAPEGWHGAIPFMLALHYFGRRLLEATGYFDTTSSGYHKDPFSIRKTALLIEQMEEASEPSLLPPTTNPEELVHLELRENLDRIFKSSSNLPLLSSNEINPGKGDLSLFENVLLTKDLTQINLVIGSSYEVLIPVLVLCDFLLTQDLVRNIRLHVKTHPTFINDVTSTDVLLAINELRRGTDVALRGLGNRLDFWLRGNHLQLEENKFWSSELTFGEIPEVALKDQLHSSNLLLIFGAVDYLRFQEDRLWPPGKELVLPTGVFTNPVAAVFTQRQPSREELPPSLRKKLPAAYEETRKIKTALVKTQNLDYQGPYSKILEAARHNVNRMTPPVGEVRVVSEFIGSIPADVARYQLNLPHVRWTEDGQIQIRESFLESLAIAEHDSENEDTQDNVSIRKLTAAILQASYGYYKWLHHLPMTEEHKKIFLRGLNGEESVDSISAGYQQALRTASSTAQVYLEEAADRLGLPHEVKWRLVNPVRIHKFRMKISGVKKYFVGWRVRHSFGRGAGKGGLRFDPKLKLAEIIMLALEMDIKTCLMGLPFDGTKGGARFDFSVLPEDKQASLVRALVAEAYEQGTIGPFIDSWAPDIGTDSKIMKWIIDEYIRQRVLDRSLRNPELIALEQTPFDSTDTPFLDKYLELYEQGKVDGSDLAAVTGKFPDDGGIHGRDAATGQGVYYAALAVAKRYLRWENFENRKVALQGLGKVGSPTAIAFHEGGAAIISVGEFNSAVRKSDRLNVSELVTHWKNHRTLDTYRGDGGGPLPKGKIGVEALFDPQAEIVILAAKQDQITMENVANFSRDKMPNLKMIIEAANGPIDRKAARWLAENRPDVIIVPDVFANAGGVTVSFIELLNNCQTREKAKRAMDQRSLFQSAFNLVREMLAWFTQRESIFVANDKPEEIEAEVLGQLKEIMDKNAVEIFERTDALQSASGWQHTPLREAAYDIVVHRKTGAPFPEERADIGYQLLASWWLGPEGWNSVPRVWMPIIEEVLRLVLIANFELTGAIVYAVFHAAAHYHFDVKAARGDHLTPLQFIFCRFPIRFIFSVFLSLPYLVMLNPQTPGQLYPEVDAFIRASVIHILNNTLIYDFVRRKLQWKWWYMSTISGEGPDRLEFKPENVAEACRRIGMAPSTDIKFVVKRELLEDNPTRNGFRQRLSSVRIVLNMDEEQVERLVDQFTFPHDTDPLALIRAVEKLAMEQAPNLFEIPSRVPRYRTGRAKDFFYSVLGHHVTKEHFLRMIRPILFFLIDAFLRPKNPADKVILLGESGADPDFFIKLMKDLANQIPVSRPRKIIGEEVCRQLMPLAQAWDRETTWAGKIRLFEAAPDQDALNPTWLPSLEIYVDALTEMGTRNYQLDALKKSDRDSPHFAGALRTFARDLGLQLQPEKITETTAAREILNELYRRMLLDVLKSGSIDDVFNTYARMKFHLMKLMRLRADQKYEFLGESKSPDPGLAVIAVQGLSHLFESEELAGQGYRALAVHQQPTGLSNPIFDATQTDSNTLLHTFLISAIHMRLKVMYRYNEINTAMLLTSHLILGHPLLEGDQQTDPLTYEKAVEILGVIRSNYASRPMQFQLQDPGEFALWVGDVICQELMRGNQNQVITNILTGKLHPKNKIPIRPFRLMVPAEIADEVQPQSWTGSWGGPWVYGFFMPLIEEALRLAVYHNLSSPWLAILCAVLVYSIVHALLHVFVDIYEFLPMSPNGEVRRGTPPNPPTVQRGGESLSVIDRVAIGLMGHVQRLPGRLVLSIWFGVLFLIGVGAALLSNAVIGTQFSPGFFGLAAGTIAHVFHNLWLRHHLPKALQWLGLLMSVSASSGGPNEESGNNVSELIREFLNQYLKSGKIDGQLFIRTLGEQRQIMQGLSNRDVLRLIAEMEPDIAAAILLSFFTNHGKWGEIFFSEANGAKSSQQIDPILLGSIINKGLGFSGNFKVDWEGREYEFTRDLRGIAGMVAYLPKDYSLLLVNQIADQHLPSYLHAITVFSVAARYKTQDQAERINSTLIGIPLTRIVSIQDKLSNSCKTYLHSIGIDVQIQPNKTSLNHRATKDTLKVDSRIAETLFQLKLMEDREISAGQMFFELECAGRDEASKHETLSRLFFGRHMSVASAILASIPFEQTSVWSKILVPDNKDSEGINQIRGLIAMAILTAKEHQLLDIDGKKISVKYDLRGLALVLKSLPPATRSALLSLVPEDSDRDFIRSVYEVERSIGHLEAGKRIGVLHLVSSDNPAEDNLRRIPKYSIVAMATLPTSSEGIGPFEGIITYHDNEDGNHASERATEWDAPYASMPRKLVEHLDGKMVVFEVKDSDHVILREANRHEIATYRRPTVEPETIILPKGELSSDIQYLAPGDARLAAPGYAGPKPAHLNWLHINPPEYSDPDIELKIAGGSVLPFSAFRNLLRLNGKDKEYDRLVASLEEIYELSEIQNTLNQIAALIKGLKFEFETDPFWNEKNLIETFYAMYDNGVFVRDANNAQNLPGFPWFGAGLYLTEPHVVGRAPFFQAILDVWADVWNVRAFKQRRRHHVDQKTIQPAIWFSPSRKKADYSLLIRTADTYLNEPNHLIVYIVQGLGEAIVSDKKEYEGNSVRLVFNKRTAELLECKPGNKSKMATLRAGGGIEVINTDSKNEFQSHPDFQKLAQAIFEIGISVEQAANCPQKIEGTLTFDPETKKGVVHLDQADPIVRRLFKPSTGNPMASTFSFTRRFLKSKPSLKALATSLSGASNFLTEEEQIERIAQRFVAWWYEILPGGWRVWESSLLPWFVLFHNNKSEDNRINRALLFTRLIGHYLVIYPLTFLPFFLSILFPSYFPSALVWQIPVALLLHMLGHFGWNYRFPWAGLTKVKRRNEPLRPAAIGYLLVILFSSSLWAKVIGAVAGLLGVWYGEKKIILDVKDMPESFRAIFGDMSDNPSVDQQSEWLNRWRIFWSKKVKELVDQAASGAEFIIECPSGGTDNLVTPMLQVFRDALFDRGYEESVGVYSWDGTLQPIYKPANPNERRPEPYLAHVFHPKKKSDKPASVEAGDSKSPYRSFIVQEIIDQLDVTDSSLHVGEFSFETVKKEDPSQIVIVPAGKTIGEIISEINNASHIVHTINDLDVRVLLTGDVREDLQDMLKKYLSEGVPQVKGIVLQSQLESEADIKARLLSPAGQGSTLIILPSGTDISLRTMEHLERLSVGGRISLFLMDRIMAGARVVIGTVQDVTKRLRLRDYASVSRGA